MDKTKLIDMFFEHEGNLYNKKEIQAISRPMGLFFRVKIFDKIIQIDIKKYDAFIKGLEYALDYERD